MRSHDLVIVYGDAEFIGHCSCGHNFGVLKPNQSLDEFALPWERHYFDMRELYG